MIERGDPIESLLDAVIDGRCDEAGLRRFEALMRDDPRIRAAYLDQMRMHALLQWRHGRVAQGLDPVEPQPAGSARGGRRRGLAAVLLVGVGLALLAARAAGRWPGAGAVATLVEARGVVWAEGQSPIAVRARITPREIRCRSGTIKLAFDSGATVTLEGPADLRVLSGMRIRAVQGRITARAEGAAKGFAIETPSTLVVDRGTEFGVEVDASGRTGVVVFEGRVDLSRPETADGAVPITRLGQGEALRVGQAGDLSRIVAVERRPGDDGWSTGPSSDRDAVIRSVRDNIRGLDSSKYYQIVRRGLDEDAPAYVDRLHQWNGADPGGLPAFLRGADYIMPFNDDKWMKELQVTVEVAHPATLYLFFDDREEIPPWLSGRFTDTGLDIGLDECSGPRGAPLASGRGPGVSVDHVLSIWECALDRDETITLGALLGMRQNMTMYGIAAVPRRPPAVPTADPGHSSTSTEGSQR